jgi:flagellar hook-basal body complex protein FliE
MALNLASMLSGPASQGLGAYAKSAIGPGGASGNPAARNLQGEAAGLVRTDPLHYSAEGRLGIPAASEEPSVSSFQAAMLRAMDGVNASQMKSSELTQKMLTDPDSVDAQDVTISMAEANMSLNLARTIMTRVVTAWKDIINTR